MSRSGVVLCIRGAELGQRPQVLAALCSEVTVEDKVHSVCGPLTTLSSCRKQLCFGVREGGTDPARARFMASSLLTAWPWLVSLTLALGKQHLPDFFIDSEQGLKAAGFLIQLKFQGCSWHRE